MRVEQRHQVDPDVDGGSPGDWREEMVWRTYDNSALRVCTTTAVTMLRTDTLMHDPTYRAQVSFD